MPREFVDPKVQVSPLPGGSEASADAQGIESDGLSGTGESTVVDTGVSGVRVQTGAVLGFGEVVLAPGQDAYDDAEAEGGDDEEADERTENAEAAVLHPDFKKAIVEHFGNVLDEVTKYGVFLIMGGHPVEVCHNSIRVRAAFELGDSEHHDPELQPTPEELIKEMSRAINLRDTLRHFEYMVQGQGLAVDQYYELVMGKDIVFDTKDTVIEELSELKEALEEIAGQNSRMYSVVPPAPDGPSGLEDDEADDEDSD